jgi:hypothetical protein
MKAFADVRGVQVSIGSQDMNDEVRISSRPK